MNARAERFDTFETENVGTLTMRAEFEFQESDGEGTHWKAYTFHGHFVHPTSGGEWVSCFGGDPVTSKDPRRQWRSFDPERIRSGARPLRSTWKDTRRA